MSKPVYTHSMTMRLKGGAIVTTQYEVDQAQKLFDALVKKKPAAFLVIGELDGTLHWIARKSIITVCLEKIDKGEGHEDQT